MEKKYFKKLILGIFIILSVVTFSKVKITKTDSYSDIEKSIESILKKSPKDTLIIFDIDNTILTSSKDLGGDVWYQWQTGKLDIKASKEQKVTNLYGDAIYLLYTLLPMNLIDEKIPSLIEKWQNESTVFALSSRAPENMFSTTRELKKYNIDFSKSPLRNKGEEINPVFIEKYLGRNMAYIDGIALTTGLNKGKVIDYLLEKTKKEYKNIIFIDDSEKNVTNVEKEFTDNEKVNMDIFYYTKIVDDRIKKNGTEVTEAEATKMAEDWNTINSALLKVYPERKNSDIYTK